MLQVVSEKEVIEVVGWPELNLKTNSLKYPVPMACGVFVTIVCELVSISLLYSCSVLQYIVISLGSISISNCPSSVKGLLTKININE